MDQAELAFIKTFAQTLSSLPVTYPDDYAQPPANSLKRVPLIPIDLPPPPKRTAAPSSSSADTLALTFKSLKPPASFPLRVSRTDAIASIKAQLAASTGRAPPADQQRLLLKGKALADNKLLQEYPVADGDTITLVLKPGFEWDPTQDRPDFDVTMTSATPPSITLDADAGATKRKGHSRIPSVVLSPSPSGSSPGEEKPADIALTFDTSQIPTASQTAGTAGNPTYHHTIADPAFWERMYGFLRGEFPKESDAADAFEDFLSSSKGNLTPHEIAKIRDQLGITGMAGR